MANRHRGEIDAVLDGKTYTLCLTLGALAHLEQAFESENLTALTHRFSSGALSAQDLLRIVGAGLRSGGHDVSDADLATMQAEGGAVGFVRIASDLLSVTFGPEPAHG
ncbi:MAG: gene transfer agent family protein [Pseudomonadota bacterium]